jgi:hypothetical protein
MPRHKIREESKPPRTLQDLVRNAAVCRISVVRYDGALGRVLEVTAQVAASARDKLLLNGAFIGSTFSRLILSVNVNSQTNR